MTFGHRYFVMDRTGRPHGPHWLAEMRRRFEAGLDGLETPVCKEGTDEWDALRTYPEITSDEAQMPHGLRAGEPRLRPSFSWGVWLLLLAAALFMGWVQFFYLE